MFFPVWIRLDLGIDQGLPAPLRLEVRLWGIRILRIPDKRSRRSGWLGRKLYRWLESMIKPSQAEPDHSAPRPKKARKPATAGFLVWAARRGLVLIGRLTRRFELRCGGVDPAFLGSLTGVVAIVQGAMGTEKIGWFPDFVPGALRVQARWDLSISAWKIVNWLGETFSDRKRTLRKP